MSSGGFWCEPEGGEPFFWPYCEIPGCPNGICFGKGETRFCWPHSDSGKTLGQLIAEHTHMPLDSGERRGRRKPEGFTTPADQ